MEYIEIRLPKCIIHLTQTEILKLLQKDPDLFAEALKRSKSFTRHQYQKERERAKFEESERKKWKDFH